MTNSQRLANVRTALSLWLESQLGEAGELTPGGESMLIRGGFYCGRRFNAAQRHAIWFMEEDELKIFDSAGKMVCVMQAAEITRWAETPVIESISLAEAPAESPQRRAA